MATYKVSYFPWKGNGEIIRLVLVIAGQDFKDERLTMDEWLKVKEASPTKHMPLLTVNGTVYGQTAACARYLARKYGLMGASPEEELLIDEVYECIVDFLKEVFKLTYEKDEKTKEELKQKIITENVPKLNDYIKLRSKLGGNGFIIGKKISLADIHLYNIVDQCEAGFPGFFSSAPDIKKHADVVKSDARIQKWIATMPKMPQ